MQTSPRRTAAKDAVVTTKDTIVKDVIHPTYDSTSFAYFLQHFPRKKDNTVRTWNGEVLHKSQFGVLDIDVPQYQQCADAIIRLHAEWLYSQRRYNDISYHFTNGFKCDFVKWARGYRIRVNGNRTSWYRKYQKEDYSYSNFKSYLNQVFYYAGTASLWQYDLVSTHINMDELDNLNIGDIILYPGSPGHAVIIIDKIIHKGTSYYLFAQSFIPAQNIEIISNDNPDIPHCNGYVKMTNYSVPDVYIECVSQIRRFKIH